MGAFAIALTALAMGTARAPSELPQKLVEVAQPKESLSAQVSLQAGFYWEPPPSAPLIVGDVDVVVSHVAHFSSLSATMEQQRTLFQKRCQEVLATLSVKSATCPVESVFPAYLEARRMGDEFFAAGRELEKEGDILTMWQRWGEDLALPPKARQQLSSAANVVKQFQSDLREMRIFLLAEIEPALRAARCDMSLATPTDAPITSSSEVRINIVPPPLRERPSRGEVVSPESRTVTYFVDNRKCNQALSVSLDEENVGTVAPGSLGSFQTFGGEHLLCVFAEKSSIRCGAPESQRIAYIHDGWSLAMHCSEGPTSKN